ncbi:MAG TPA: Asp-tRNA(Asn)/Glu-tRNA(Gln) amidotransferase GatCAB subunit A, partial [Gammaproteobacteria bacterium]|nr:Asp-tRNA(Asn)/Glu-tRNA(Gln) amidotransferase GatCAB subunit A [Gammaproteobacteria bacterium]
MPHRQSLSSLRKMLQTKKISSVELTSHFLQRIDQNRELNAFITVDAETALANARQADISLNDKSGDLLTGLPLALKDIFCTRGMLTSCGSRMLANFTSPYDATVTERLNAAGSVLLGKTNMDEFAM